MPPLPKNLGQGTWFDPGLVEQCKVSPGPLFGYKVIEDLRGRLNLPHPRYLAYHSPELQP